MAWNYLYSSQSQLFSFIRFPKLLLEGCEFSGLSMDAKVLYGLMLDRVSLSEKNGWCDELDRIYIYYTVKEICAAMNCGHEKAIKLLAELDEQRGIGLIERVKQGQGKPTRIYVRSFTEKAGMNTQGNNCVNSRLPIFRSQEVGKTDVKTSDIPKSRLLVFGSAEVAKSETINTNNNQTEVSYTNPSIYPVTAIDGFDVKENVKEQIDYELLCLQYSTEDIEGIVDLIADTLSSDAEYIRIGGSKVPSIKVKTRFERLGYSHIEYVIDSFQETTTKIKNIRAYLLTALYNAPLTIGPHYSAAVRHDEKGD